MTDTLDYQNVPLPLSAAPQYWFSASTSDQTIVGNSGNDAIYGVGGDTLVGGTGDDTFYVTGTDQVIVAPGGGVDTIVTYWGGYTLPSNVQNLVVQGDGAYGVGNSLDNIIEAVGPGEITLDGGGGNNVLIGGTGETIFVHAVNNSNDVITNFQPGLDKVRIENTDLFTFAAIQSQMQQVGNDVVLNLAPDDSITFRNVQVGQFSAQDFMLPLDYSNLQMSFDDEFNSLSLRSGNSGTWSTAYWWAQPNGATLSTNGELEWYINSSYAPTSSVKPWTVNNGILNLTAAPASPSIQPLIDNYQYTSGMLTTHDSFVQTYGVYEINAKVPAGQGLWVDFWLVPENGSWPPELDVMEINGGNPTSLNTGIHSASTGTSTSIGTDTPIPDASAGFHTYTVDWEPNTITWYFDHNEVFQTATPADMNQPMYMLLDLAVGGPYGNPNSSTQFPADFEVNYVHVYATTAASPIISQFSAATTNGVVNTATDSTTADQLTLTGTAEGDSTVSIYDNSALIGNAAANGVGAWSFTTGLLKNGVHNFTATDTNAADNTSASSSTLTVTVDGAVPNAPVIQSIVANPSTGDLGPGKTVSFTVTISEPVKITGGMPFLELNDGGEAIYKSGSGTNVLTFNYTVGALGSGQNAASLAVTGFNPNGATVYDSNIAADTADLSGVTAFSSGPQIDTMGPTVTSVVAMPANGDLDASKTVILTVTFSEMVTVTGTPYLALNDGGKATYTAGFGTDALTFTYIVASGQNTSDLAVNRLALNGGTIKDGAGNNAVLSGAAGSLSGILQIDTVAPKIQSITASGSGITAGTGDLGPGTSVTLTVNFNEAVNVDTTDGTPSLALNDGGNAIYSSGFGSNALMFTYTVGDLGSGQNTPNLALTASNAFMLNGASITDAAGNAAALTAANGYNPAGTLQIDTTAPTVTKVVTSPTSGEETTGHTVRVTIDMSEKVTVAGSPTLLLNDGGTASYDPSHSSATALAFDYTVASGQVTTDLVVSGIELTSASAIADQAGNTANLAGAGANLGLQINTKSTGAAGPSGGNYTVSGSTDLQLFGASTTNVTFGAGSTGTATLDASTEFAGNVAGLSAGDYLDLSDIGFGASSTLGYIPSSGNTGGVLTVSDGVHVANIALLGQYAASSFVMASDGHGGTLVTDPPELIAQSQLTKPHG